MWVVWWRWAFLLSPTPHIFGDSGVCGMWRGVAWWWWHAAFLRALRALFASLLTFLLLLLLLWDLEKEEEEEEEEEKEKKRETGSPPLPLLFGGDLGMGWAGSGGLETLHTYFSSHPISAVTLPTPPADILSTLLVVVGLGM